MTQLDKLKLYLNIPLDNVTKDNLLSMLLDESKHEIRYLSNNTEEFMGTNPVAQSIVVKVAVVKYNRQGTEGLKSQSFANSSETFIDGIEAEVKKQLQSITKVKVM